MLRITNAVQKFVSGIDNREDQEVIDIENGLVNPPRVPTFGISWYKYGGILQGARIIGSLGDKYIGAGEAGPEAVLPLYSFYSELRNIITELVDRNAGPTEFNQYNSYYSPKDLSPAECARKTRDETRQLLKNVKRA